MNHNLLISKYLDGDLSHEEDNELRRLLSEDSLIKEEFDTATMLHFIMKEDAASVVPLPQFILETEEIILGKYAELPTMLDTPSRSIITKTTRNFTSTVAVLLLLLVLPFGDTEFNFLPSFSNSEPDTQDYSNSVTSRGISGSGRGIHHNKTQYSYLKEGNTKEYPSTSFQASGENATINSIQHDAVSESLLVNSNTPQGEDSFNSLQINSTLERSKNQNESNAIQSVVQLPNSQSVNAPKTTLEFQPLMSSLQSEQNKNQEIQVSTFVSTMISVQNNYTYTSASFSQSIAYSLNDDNSVGMEVGYFGYSYQDGGTVLVPKSNTSGLSSKILGMDDPAPNANDAKVERSSSSLSAGFDEKKVEYSLEKKMYWGAAFYEHTILNSGNISFNGRIGVGGSNDGPMAFSRAFARYNIYSGIAITLGAEANAFMIHAPMMSGKEADVTSGVSLVYGMQIKF